MKETDMAGSGDHDSFLGRSNPMLDKADYHQQDRGERWGHSPLVMDTDYYFPLSVVLSLWLSSFLEILMVAAVRVLL